MSYENTISIVGFTPGATFIVNVHTYSSIHWSIGQTVLFGFKAKTKFSEVESLSWIIIVETNNEAKCEMNQEASKKMQFSETDTMGL